MHHFYICNPYFVFFYLVFQTVNSLSLSLMQMSTGNIHMNHQPIVTATEEKLLSNGEYSQTGGLISDIGIHRF